MNNKKFVWRVMREVMISGGALMSFLRANSDEIPKVDGLTSALRVSGLG